MRDDFKPFSHAEKLYETDYFKAVSVEVNVLMYFIQVFVPPPLLTSSIASCRESNSGCPQNVSAATPDWPRNSHSNPASQRPTRTQLRCRLMLSSLWNRLHVLRGKGPFKQHVTIFWQFSDPHPPVWHFTLIVTPFLFQSWMLSLNDVILSRGTGR